MRAQITRQELLAFVRSLGVDPGQTKHITITSREIAVTTYQAGERGWRYNDAGAKRAASPAPGHRPQATTTTKTTTTLIKIT